MRTFKRTVALRGGMGDRVTVVQRTTRKHTPASSAAELAKAQLAAAIEAEAERDSRAVRQHRAITPARHSRDGRAW